MPLESPVTGVEWAESLSGGSAGNIVGSPNTDDANTKYFKRNGWTIEDIPAQKIPSVSNDRKNVAFRVSDTSGPINGRVKASDPIAVFGREDEDVEISLGSHFDGGNTLFQLEDRAEGSEARGFSIDASDDGQGVKLLQSSTGCTVRDVGVRGEMDGSGKWSSGGAYVTVPRGQKVVLENLKLPGGASRNYGVPSHHDSIGVILNGTSNGVLEMNGCEIGGFPNNGVYASGTEKHGNDGYAIVKNHTGYNSDRDQVRLGGAGGIYDSDLYINKKKPGFNNLRGIWFRHAKKAEVENTSIKTYHGHDPGSAIRIDSTAQTVDIRNVDVELRGNHFAARGVQTHSPSKSGDNSVLIEDSSFYGDASPKDVILIKSGRDGSDVRNTSINVSNPGDELDIR